jgi:predicted nucleotidyltransferase
MAAHPLDHVVGPLAAALALRPEVLEAYVFGSVARGQSGQISDIDVAVYVDPQMTARAPYGYAADLSTALGTALERNDIDVVVLNDAPPLLYHRVLTGGARILSRDLRATTTREGRALSRYCDYLPQLTLIDAAVSARLARDTFGR